MNDYKLNTEKIKELIKSPPALGIEITTPNFNIIEEVGGMLASAIDKYAINCCYAVNVDPDALIKTANKNEELMDILADLNHRIESGNLVEVVRCKDCEHWTATSFDAITEQNYGICCKPLGEYRSCETTENDFCSYAEMKGGE